MEDYRPTGVGKNWIACALGHKACRDDRRVMYHRVPRFSHALIMARGYGRDARVLKSIVRIPEDLGSHSTRSWAAVPRHRGHRLLIVTEN